MANIRNTQESFSEVGIEVGSKISGQHKFKCPQCSEGRKNKSDTPLSVNIDKGVYHCHHCGWKGAIGSEPLAKWENSTTLSDKAVEWFSMRNIGQETLRQMRITEKNNAICFPYYKDGQLQMTKVRTYDKKFWVEPREAPKVFYNVDGIKGQKQIYIVEGEIDCLTMIGLGYTNTVSVPLGANEANNNLKWVSTSDFTDAELIYIATDDDPAGHGLARDLISLLGMDRCKRILFGGYKDINELYCKEGNLSKLTFDNSQEEKYGTIITRDLVVSKVTPLVVAPCGAPVVYRNGITSIAGSSKSGKSHMIKAIVKAALGKESGMGFGPVTTDKATRVLYLDFELEHDFVQQFEADIDSPNVTVISMRSVEPKYIMDAIKYWINKYKPDLLIIDTFADLFLPNEEADAFGIIRFIMGLADSGITIVTSIHYNPGSPTKTRGHAGSYLQRKGTVELSITTDKETRKIHTPLARKKPIQPFWVQYDEQAHDFVLCDQPVKEERKDTVLSVVMAGQSYSLEEIINRMKENEPDLIDKTAKSRIRKAVYDGKLNKREDGFYQTP